MATAEEIQGAVHAYIERSNENDKDAVVAMFAPDAQWFDPVGAPPHLGRTGVAEFWDQTRAMADRIEMKARDVIVAGGEAALIGEIYATIGGNTMVMDLVETFAFDEEGRFLLVKAYWDMGRARSQSA
jgi:ketosteroid isomerase-like protein